MVNVRIHKMELPKTVIIGEKILSKLSEIYKSINGKAIAIITGPNIYHIIREKIYNGMPDLDESKVIKVKSSAWNEINKTTYLLGKYGKNIQYILGVGGGKAIDVAKMTAYKLNKHFISIPTSPSHDGIASQFVSIKDSKYAYSIPTKPPLAIIVDVDIVYKAPKRLIASGFGDAIAKITAVKDWQLARDKVGEYYGDYAANLALLGAKMIIKQAEGIGKGRIESIRVLIEALISDGVAAGIAGSSRPCSGSEHLFSHALDMFSTEHALHGEQCGLGTIIMSYLHGLDYSKIRKALKKAGAPTTADEIGISRKNLITALINARKIRPDRYTILNEIKMNERVAYDILKSVEVI